MYRCFYCKKEFRTMDRKSQHIRDKHSSLILMTDEMLNADMLQPRFQNVIVKNQPDHMKSHLDHDMINFIKMKGYGLITKDYDCAQRASLEISPVFFINEYGDIQQFN